MELQGGFSGGGLPTYSGSSVSVGVLWTLYTIRVNESLPGDVSVVATGETERLRDRPMHVQLRGER